MNELLEEEEDEEVPPAGGGTEAPGGSEALGESQIPRGAEGATYIIVDEGGDEAPHGGSVPPGPQGGEKASDEGPKAPVGAPKGPTQRRLETEAEGSMEAPKAGTTVGTTTTPGAAAGARPTTRETQGAPSSQKGDVPQAR